MRAVQGKPGTAAHHDPAHQGEIGLGIEFDAAIEPVFLTPEAELFGMTSGLAKVIQNPDVAARTKSLVTHTPDDDAVDPCVILPPVQRGRNLAHHSQGQRVECLGAVERDDAARAHFLASDFRLPHDPSSAQETGTGGKIIMPRHRAYTVTASIYFVQVGSLRSSRLDISPARTKSP